ncbi:MAG: heparinase II/III family protein, partial [Paludibacter sp.]
MKNTNLIKTGITLILTLCLFMAKSQTVDNNVFTYLNLNYKGLEEVKKLHELGKDTEACAALLTYYKNRNSIINPDMNLNRISISKDEQGWADDAMEHKFFSHEGFKPSLFYGKEIDWNYWPVKDNELRWQLHRLKW